MYLLSGESADNIQVDFLWNNKKICHFRCNNYGEMIKFLHYCKKYQVNIWPNEFDDSIPKDIEEEMTGIGGVIKEYWFTLPTEVSMPCIEVEIGIGD